MLQLMLDFENNSEADAKTATSFAPAATAARNPWKKVKFYKRGFNPSMFEKKKKSTLFYKMTHFQIRS